jgi:hypothetical protein
VKGVYSQNISSEIEIASKFYSDMKQIFLNCIVFNTELSPTVAQAYKFLHILARYMDRWVISRDRSPFSQCNDSYCLLSHSIIPYTFEPGAVFSIKCARCTGVFSLDAVSPSDCDEILDPYLIPPTEKQIKQSHEEWFCPLCLREDSNNIVASDIGLFDDLYCINEWGPAAHIPWIFHPRYSLTSSNLGQQSVNYQLLLQALEILVRFSKSNLVTPIINIESYHVKVHTTTNSWNLSDRIIVLSALCEVMKSSIASQEYVNSVWLNCEKLSSLCTRTNFREADFIECVELIAGQQGVSVCRAMFDGIQDDEYGKQNKLIVGRCVLCRRSTFDEDCNDEDVLLCDGCNAEAHLSCTGMVSVNILFNHIYQFPSLPYQYSL